MVRVVFRCGKGEVKSEKEGHRHVVGKQRARSRARQRAGQESFAHNGKGEKRSRGARGAKTTEGGNVVLSGVEEGGATLGPGKREEVFEGEALSLLEGG